MQSPPDENLYPIMIDAAVLKLLVDTEPRVWSTQELEAAPELGVPLAGSLGRLADIDLIHRVDRYAWASRGAVEQARRLTKERRRRLGGRGGKERRLARGSRDALRGP